MATISVRTEDADRLLRGGVCAKTGLPATAVIEMRVVHTPSWIWILLLAGIFPLVIAYAFTKEEVRIGLPATEDVVGRRRRNTLTMHGTAIASLLLIATSAVVDNPAPAWLGAVGLVGVVMALPFAARTWINARYDGERIHLTGLHPNYVAASGLTSS